MSPLWWGGLAASSWHGKMNGKLRDHIFNFKREAEKERKEEVKRGSGISKPARRDLLPSARTNLPNISKQHQQGKADVQAHEPVGDILIILFHPRLPDVHGHLMAK